MFTIIKKHKLLLSLFFALFLTVYSCKKSIDIKYEDVAITSALLDPSKEMDINLAKKYYAQLKKDEGVYVKELNTKNATLDLTKYKVKNRKYAIFKKAYESGTKKSTLVEVPIVYDHRVSNVMMDEKSHKKSTTSDREEIFRSSFDRLIIYKDKSTGKVSHRLVTYIPELKYLRKHNGNVKHNQINKLDDDFTGFIQFKKWDGTALYTLQYVNGKKVRYIPFVKRRAANKTQNEVTSGSGIICEFVLVEIWGESCIGAGPESDTGDECTPYLIESYYDIECTGDPEDPCIDYGECGTGDPCIDYGECWSEGVWDPNTAIVFLEQGDRITDIKKELKCFNTGATATFTLFVDQPVNNSSATYAGTAANPYVGHTFIGITQGGIQRIIGFYPVNTVYPLVANSSPSGLFEDSNHSFDVSISFGIGATALANLLNAIEDYPATYDLNTFNCTDFGISMLNVAGNFTYNSTTGTWPGGGGHNPGNLGQDLRSTTFGSGVTKNTTAGNAPAKNGTCN